MVKRMSILVYDDVIIVHICKYQLNNITTFMFVLVYCKLQDN